MGCRDGLLVATLALMCAVGAPKSRRRTHEGECAASLPAWLPRRHLRKDNSAGQTITQLSFKPHILHMDRLLSPTECTLILQRCAGKWRRALTTHTHADSSLRQTDHVIFSSEEVAADPDGLEAVYDKLGIPVAEQEVLAGVEGARKVAVDAVFDSVSVATTFREELKKAGVIFLSISEAIKEYPELVKKWLGKVVPQHDNFFATLNCAVFSDAPSSMCLKACAARWNSAPISASMPKIPASSSAL